MDLGFIESKTYEEIRVGDKATTEHVLTSEDAMAFASISGFHSVLRSDELIERAGGVPPTGPNMWCASLVSGLFSMNIPGPGCTLTHISLSFHNRIHVGDRILVRVQVTAKQDATKSIALIAKQPTVPDRQSSPAPHSSLHLPQNSAGPPSPCPSSS